MISGGGIECYISTPVIINCTISGNHADQLGGGIESFDSSPTIVNTIIEGNTGFGGIYFFNSLDASLTYCDLFDNEEGNLTGAVPTGLGELITTNANGDSCDLCSNIFLDPLFYSTSGDSAYFLLEDSPCIDAGDPASPLDPDGTTADIGMYFFYQETSPPPVSLLLTPYGTPIQIPATGGSFDFNIAVANNEPLPQNFDVWIMATLPGGTQFGPLLGPANLILPANASIDRDRTQIIPENAPLGIYSYEAYAGIYPNDVWDSDNFEFEKLDYGVGIPFDEWINIGDDFGDKSKHKEAVEPSEFRLQAYPNPFNPTTAISFQLSALSYVNLTVYDIQGREVAELVNGWRNAGYHEVAFDASNLSSGIYLCRISVAKNVFSMKIVLVK